MSENLFQEAIADAKKIRDLAEENAKKAVLEAVTPKIKEFIENTILEQDSDSKEEEDEKEEGETDEDVELDESAIQSLLALLGENSENNEDLKEAVSRLTGDERNKLFGLIDKNDQINENYNSGDIFNLKENNKMNSREKYYEIDLKALREAVEEEESNEMYDMGEALYEEEEDDADKLLADNLPEEGEEMDMDMGEEPAGDNMLSRDEVERQIEELIADLGLEIGAGGEMEDDMPDLDLGEMEEEEPAEGEEEPDQLAEVFDVDPRMLQRELRRIRNRVNEAKGGALAHESGGIAKDYEHHFGGKGSANSKGGDFGGGKPGKDVLAEMRQALRNQRRQNGALENKLTKYRSAVQTLREQLEELNLFNAKLLYVNKLLQNKSINESQKRSIVKALDEAKDLREAKVLYKSLTESFSKSTKSSAKTLNESARMASSSRATKPAGSHSSNATGEVDRWARLAGLRK